VCVCVCECVCYWACVILTFQFIEINVFMLILQMIICETFTCIVHCDSPVEFCRILVVEKVT